MKFIIIYVVNYWTRIILETLKNIYYFAISIRVNNYDGNIHTSISELVPPI